MFVHVPAGERLAEPLRLTIRGAAGDAIEWRALIVLEEGAEAEVWERYESGGEGLFNGVTEIVLGDGANLRYVCEQELSDDGWVFATQRAEVGQEANLDWVALGFGSSRGKVRMETKLAGRGSSAKVTGAYAGLGNQHLDYDTTQEHAAPDTASDLAFRGVLSGSATAVWRGMIRVDPPAQRTDAFQESRNLLLSDKAHADAIPGLEIEADDVRCTHAAAVAQVDAEQLYYLRSRGLREADAKKLVIDGFLQELVERTVEGPIRDALASSLERRLGELLAEPALRLRAVRAARRSVGCIGIGCRAVRAALLSRNRDPRRRRLRRRALVRARRVRRGGERRGRRPRARRAPDLDRGGRRRLRALVRGGAGRARRA